VVDYMSRLGSPTIMPAEPLYERIRSDLARRIAAGEWRPGDRLPTQPELVVQYTAILRQSVSLQPVKAALTLLEKADGLIVTHQGKGMFVADRATPHE
jgi:DNA-binding GntR family transcriptional regulator